jgi:hypothetical protein
MCGSVVTRICAFAALCLSLVAGSCKRADPGEDLARLHCGSCHLFPEPALLDKSTWVMGVLPQMAFRMGIPNREIISRIPGPDRAEVMSTMPGQPLITDQQLVAIRNYYYDEAPDSLQHADVEISETTELFKTYPAPAEISMVTSIRFDKSTGKIYVGNRSPEIYRLNSRYEIEKSIHVTSPPTDIELDGKDGGLMAVLVGIILPNDQRRGELVKVDPDFTTTHTVIDSLRRPVHVSVGELNSDGERDMVISEFGHFKGQLSLFSGPMKSQTKSALNLAPGTRRTIVADFNGDSRPDILALLTQGDEKIVVYEMQDNGSYVEKVLLRFPPVNGSSYFELNDFNSDGKLDILYANGDNGDYSIVTKPYHGVKIYINDGQNNYSEAWSFPMPGAQEARAVDFDKDGDLDIVAISYFPEFDRHHERSIIYFNNTGSLSFEPQLVPLAATGRWLVMETGDFDNDADIDVLIGSMSQKGLGATEEVYQEWVREGNAMLIMENIHADGNL